MFVIDRYLLRQFVQTFVICFLSLTGLYIVLDLFTNMDNFVRCGHKSGSVLGFIAQFYWYHSDLVLQPHQRHVDAGVGHVHRRLDSTP